MAQYFLQEGSLELPDIFKDRTMNLFTLSEHNASEFTFVVSRASASKDDRVQGIAARLVSELKNTLRNFALEFSRMTEIDGHQAVELFYHFNNGDALIWQKQSVILLDEGRYGKKMVCYIGTCPNDFSEYYQKQYQSIIDSIKFRQTEADDYVSIMISANSQQTYFALDKDSKELFVFTALNNLYQHINLQRALNDCYLFFDCAGNPLHIAPVAEEHPVRYALWTTSPIQAQSLEVQLPLCRSVSGPTHLQDIPTITAFIRHNREQAING
ncbi:DcrB-related protein [Brenneria sp. 4F2]|nr:DcrB-related protein [Brenneria bubanii]